MIIAVVAGLLVGISLGAMGGGGAIITVPALAYGLSQSPAEATTGSLVIVGVSSLTAALPHARAGRVRWLHGLVFGVLGIAGTWLGSKLSAGINPSVLMLAFGLLLFLVAALMWRKASRAGKSTQTGDGDETASPWSSPLGILRVVLAALGVGLLTGFFGVGGGFAIVPALVIVLGFSMPVAVGTSLLVIALNSASALVARLSGGVELDWAIIGLFTAVAVLGSLPGARVTSMVSAATLQKSFAVLLVVVGVYTAVRSVLALT